MSNPKTITEKKALIKLDNPSEVKAFAVDLAGFINKSNLAMLIGDKKYVLVEGWQFAGASMGIYPMVTSSEKITEEGEVTYKTKYGDRTSPIYKYRVTVDLIRLSDDKIIGRGMAMCSNQEYKKQTFDEYAIESMAQTRAVGKAFRLTLGWVVKLAGFEGTPAEEADTVIDVDEVAEENEVVSNDMAKDKVENYLGNISNPTDKLKFLKKYAGTVKDRDLTDNQYQLLYAALPDDFKVENEVQSSE